jgi:glyoxylase-like metal-dependent hydrolase (beta-lactamase superfamily II)
VGTVFAYLVAGDPLTLIDTGVGYPEARQALETGLLAKGYRLADIRRVLITHAHADHAGNAGWVQERSGAEVWIHPDEGRKLEQADWYREGRLAVMESSGMPPEEQAQIERYFRMGRAWQTLPSWRPLSDGQRLDFAGGQELEAVVLPGHALGHTGFRTGETLVGGDHLLRGITPNPIMEPVLPGHPDAVAHAPDRALTLGQFLRSLERVAALPLRLVLPGHGQPILDHRKVVREYEATHNRRLETVLSRLNGGRTAWEVTLLLYPRVTGFDRFLALSEVLAHLDLLVVRNRAALTGNLFAPK